MFVSADLPAGQVPEYDLKLFQFVFVASRSQRSFPDFFCPAETVGLHGPEHDLKLQHLFAADRAACLCPEYDFKFIQFVFVLSLSKRSFHVFSAAVAAAVAAGRAVGTRAIAVAS